MTEMPPDHRPLEQKPTVNQVMVALRRIIRSIDIHSRTLVKHYGLTGPQLVVLQEIYKREEITPGQLAKAISLSQGTVTGILERLEKRGLVVRRRSQSDRRRVLVEATAAGRELMATAPPLMQEAFVERFGDLQDWEQTMILSALQRLVAIMDAKAIHAAPILAAGPIEAPAAKPETQN